MLTVGQRGHPGLDRVRETLDERTQAQDGRVQRAQRFGVSRILSLRYSRLTRQRDEAILQSRVSAKVGQEACLKGTRP